MLTAAVLALSLLLQNAPATPSTTAPSSRPSVDSLWRYRKDIEKFAKLDSEKFPAPGAVLFIGSSTFTRWDTIKAFPEFPTLNRAFGGSTLPEVIYFVDRVAIQYKPKVVVVYCGENDVAGGASVETTVANVERLVQMLHTALPEAKVVYLGLKPSPLRQKHWEAFRAVNTTVSAKAGEWGMTYVDFWPVMSPDGQPHEEWFVGDRLHNNAAGYDRLKSVLLPAIQAEMK